MQPVAALTLLKQVAFAYVSCNGDAHAKNFSIRQLGHDEWRVTPAYDLPSSYPYGDTTMALPINDRTREDIGRRDFLALGAAVGRTQKRGPDAGPTPFSLALARTGEAPCLSVAS